MGIFNRSDKDRAWELPHELTLQEEPVNYNSVLDYLVGLGQKDYEKLLKSSKIYRDANKQVAKVLGIKDEATVTLVPKLPSEEDMEVALDKALNGDFIADDIDTPKPIKKQSTSKKVEL